jgi:hypothetical protein
MPKYRKKPMVVEAFRYDGDLIDINGNYYVPDWAIEAFEKDVLFYDEHNDHPFELFIKTLEGINHVSVGDYIVKGTQGEFYPCKPDIFKQIYEEIIDDNKKQKETYLSKYLRENNCSYEEFVKDQEMYDGFCPVILESPCSKMDCIECWNQEVKEE